MGKPSIKREELILKCEDYMLRGYDRPTEISQLVGVAYNTAREYISIVKTRWEMQGDPSMRESARVEMVRKAQEVIKEGWLLKSNAKNTMEKVSALRVVLHAIERVTKLQGLDTNHQDRPVVMSIEFQRQRQVMALAEGLNQLSAPKKAKALEMVRAELKKRQEAKEKS